MKKLQAIGAVLSVLALATACGGPSPKKVCEHMLEVIPMMASAPNALEECIEGAERQRSEDSAEYNRMARCALKASTMADIMACQ